MRYLLQVTLFPTSNVPEDAVTNSWSAEVDDLTAAIAFKDAVIAEYLTARDVWPTTVRQNDHVWKLYDRDDPAPIYPADEGTWSFPVATTGDPAPPEVALCLSFQGLVVSGTPQARRRGRAYFGPLDANKIGTDGRPVAGLISDLEDFGNNLLTASNAAASWTWCVFSGASDANVPIANGWVDNEFDTQRRRGRRYTARTVFP